MATIVLESPAFTAGGVLPRRHTAEGENLSPPLRWSGVPADTKELALICDDPDAPRSEPWVHWVAYGVAPTLAGLPEGVPTVSVVGEPSLKQGPNDSGGVGYSGPLPPKGHGVHHYHFRLYALDAPLGLGPGARKGQVVDALAEHVIDQGEIVGTYERR